MQCAAHTADAMSIASHLRRLGGGYNISESADFGQRHFDGVKMELEITSTPRVEDEEFVIAKTREYNRNFAENDLKSLCVFVRDDAGEIVGGLTGRTYWQYLDIAYLWVAERHRSRGYATKIMDAAESEALRRGCRRAFLDTLSFQALGFYQKRGYAEFGRLSGFSGKHERHYLWKRL